MCSRLSHLAYRLRGHVVVGVGTKSDIMNPKIQIKPIKLVQFFFFSIFMSKLNQTNQTLLYFICTYINFTSFKIDHLNQT